MSNKRGTRKPTADGWQKAVEQVQKQEKPTAEIIVSAKTPGQKAYIQEIQNNDIVLCIGPAGSGKTIIAVGMALQMLFEGKYNKIVIMRPAVEACGEKIGFLPGSKEEKVSNFVAPVFDNMEAFLSKSMIRDLVSQDKIEIVPLGFDRGRTFNKAFVIVDEGSNLTVQQTLLVLTRIGFNSKMVINGDLMQSDLSEQNGLEDAIKRLDGLPKVGFVKLETTDIVRHPLIAEIIKRYIG